MPPVKDKHLEDMMRVYQMAKTPSSWIRRSWDKCPLCWLFPLLGIGVLLGHLFW